MYTGQLWVFLQYLFILIFIVFKNFIGKKCTHVFSLIDCQI